MVIVVPAFPHGEQSKPGQIVTLDRMSLEIPPPLTMIVSEVTNHPVAGQGEGDTA